MINLWNIILIGIAIFFVLSIIIIGLIFIAPNPSFTILVIANILGVLVHGGLAVFMWYFRRSFNVGNRIEYRDPNTKRIELVEIINIEGEIIKARRDIGDEVEILTSEVVDSWIISILVDTLLSPDFNGSESNLEKFNIIQSTIIPGRKVIRILSLTRSTAIFSGLTSLAHLFLVLMGKQYRNTINNGLNITRWIEYTITSGIMMVNLGSVNDISRLNEILSVFVCTAITNGFGLAIEATNNTFLKIIFMIMGFIPFALPWYIVFNRLVFLYNFFIENFLGSFEDDEVIFGETKVGSIRETINSNLTLLGGLTGVLLFLFFLFPAIQIWQIIVPSKYRLGELLFIISSLVSKVSLNIGVFLLSRRPNVSNVFVEDQ